MSLADFRPTISLSEPFRLTYPQSHSDSDSSLSQDETGSAAWPACATAYPLRLEENISDDDTESMTSSTLTDCVPSLTRDSSISSFTESAMLTDVASAVQGGCVLETDDGILTLASSQHFELDADLLCPFQILDCADVFSSVREFKIHVFSHFRGHPLPAYACCFLCDNKFHQTDEDDPAMAWNKMLGHMAHDHFRCGQELGTIKADFNLMRWMYDRKIISDHYFKRSQVCPTPTVLPAANRRMSDLVRAPGVELPVAPSSPTVESPVSIESEPSPRDRRSSYGGQAYVTFAGARAERRRRDSTRPVVRQYWTTS